MSAAPFGTLAGMNRPEVIETWHAIVGGGAFARLGTLLDPEVGSLSGRFSGLGLDA